MLKIVDRTYLYILQGCTTFRGSLKNLKSEEMFFYDKNISVIGNVI